MNFDPPTLHRTAWDEIPPDRVADEAWIQRRGWALHQALLARIAADGQRVVGLCSWYDGRHPDPARHKLGFRAVKAFAYVGPVPGQNAEARNQKAEGAAGV